MTKRRDEGREFERRLRSRLHDETANIDADTAARLRQARSAALAQLDERRWQVSRWLPAGALAASLALILVLAVLPERDGLPGEQPGEELIARGGPGEDLELLYAEDDLELYEDLEFLQWLDAGGDQG